MERTQIYGPMAHYGLNLYMAVSQNGGFPKKDGLQWNILLKWMTWGKTSLGTPHMFFCFEAWSFSKLRHDFGTYTRVPCTTAWVPVQAPTVFPPHPDAWGKKTPRSGVTRTFYVRECLEIWIPMKMYLVVHPTNRKWVITPVISGLTLLIPCKSLGI